SLQVSIFFLKEEDGIREEDSGTHRSLGREIERDPPHWRGRPLRSTTAERGATSVSALIGSGSELSGKSVAMGQKQQSASQQYTIGSATADVDGLALGDLLAGGLA